MTRSRDRDIEAKTARRIVTTGCGQGTVFGDLMGQIDAIHLPPAGEARISQSTLYRLLETMRELETLHRGAGSVHGCALFRGDEMLVFVEDVGRHNAIDTIAGWMVLHGVAGGDKTLYTTGRLTSEMVMKAAQLGVPIIVSRNGVTAMGLDVASKLGMTLIGRAVKRRLLCYTGAERFDAEPEPHPVPVRTRSNSPKTPALGRRGATYALRSFSRRRSTYAPAFILLAVALHANFSGLSRPARAAPRPPNRGNAILQRERIMIRSIPHAALLAVLSVNFGAVARADDADAQAAQPSQASSQQAPLPHVTVLGTRAPEDHYRIETVDSLGPLGTTPIQNLPIRSASCRSI